MNGIGQQNGACGGLAFRSSSCSAVDTCCVATASPMVWSFFLTDTRQREEHSGRLVLTRQVVDIVGCEHTHANVILSQATA